MLMWCEKKLSRSLKKKRIVFLIWYLYCYRARKKKHITYMYQTNFYKPLNSLVSFMFVVSSLILILISHATYFGFFIYFLIYFIYLFSTLDPHQFLRWPNCNTIVWLTYSFTVYFFFAHILLKTKELLIRSKTRCLFIPCPTKTVHFPVISHHTTSKKWQQCAV